MKSITRPDTLPGISRVCRAGAETIGQGLKKQGQLGQRCDLALYMIFLSICVRLCARVYFLCVYFLRMYFFVRLFFVCVYFVLVPFESVVFVSEFFYVCIFFLHVFFWACIFLCMYVFVHAFF